MQRDANGNFDKLGAPVNMVTRNSATDVGLGPRTGSDDHPINADHRSLARFASDESAEFIDVVARIRELLDDPPARPARALEERRAREAREREEREAARKEMKG